MTEAAPWFFNVVKIFPVQQCPNAGMLRLP